MIDTGVLHDMTYSGGRIGVMSFSQEQVIWSKILYRCSGKAQVCHFAFLGLTDIVREQIKRENNCFNDWKDQLEAFRV